MDELAREQGSIPGGANANFLQGVLLAVFAYVALSLFIGALALNAIAGDALRVRRLLAFRPSVSHEFQPRGLGQLGSYRGYPPLDAAAFAHYADTAMLANTSFQRVILPIGGKA